MEDAQYYFNFRPMDRQRRRNPASQMDDRLQRHRCNHWLVRWVGCTVIFILVSAVMALGLWAIGNKEALDAARNTCAYSPRKGRIDDWEWDTLRLYLCKTEDSHAAENSSCKLCPKNWLLHEDKCLWISKTKQTWNNSQKDCARKRAQLVVLQEPEDLDFIQSITEGAQLLWIGLKATSPAGKWTWVDGFPLNHTLLQVTGANQANSCGMLKGTRVISEACDAVTKWICETFPLQL